jgi:hypothetical protein
MTRDESNDIKRHLDVMAEDLRLEFRLVAEGVATNAQRIDTLQTEMGGGFGRVNLRLDGVEGELRKGFRELGERVERLETRRAL